MYRAIFIKVGLVGGCDYIGVWDTNVGPMLSTLR